MKFFKKRKAKKEEERQLKKLDTGFIISTSLKIWTHFDGENKHQALKDAPTQEELREEESLYTATVSGSLSSYDHKLALLKLMDSFMASARRVGTDAEIATCLPDNTLDAGTIAFLKEKELNALAAVVRAKVDGL